MSPRTVLALYVALLVCLGRAIAPMMARLDAVDQVVIAAVAGALLACWFWPRFRAYAAERGETW